MRRTLVTAVASLGFASTLHAQIEVGTAVHVSAARPRSSHREISIAADPKDAERLVVGVMLDTGAARSVHTTIYTSFDGGATWSNPVYTKEHFGDDPTCAYAPDGSVYCVVKSDLAAPRDSQASDNDFLAIYRSRDGGKNWETPVYGPQSNDRPWLAIDWSSGALYIAHEQHIHGESTKHGFDDFRHALRLLTSHDGGKTFEWQAYRALMDQHADTGANSIACNVRVLSDGTVAILQHHAVTHGAQASGKAHETAAWLQMFRSTNGGRSLEPGVKIADYTSGYNKPTTKGVPADLAVDPGSAEFKDRLYAVWADYGSGHGEISVSYSADAGKTWSGRKVISEKNDVDNFMTAVAVNKAGVVGVIWYDRRDHPDAGGYDVRFTASTDGGVTWRPSVLVAKAATQNINPGDTTGLTADAAGVFRAAWIDSRTGVPQVWTAPITVK